MNLYTSAKQFNDVSDVRGNYSLGLCPALGRMRWQRSGSRAAGSSSARARRRGVDGAWGPAAPRASGSRAAPAD